MQFSSTTRSINRFSRSNGARGLTSREPMTLDTIREVAPSVFAEDKHASRSSRYTFIPTSQIVEHLMGRDYGVFSVNQGGSRDAEKRGYTKHMIRLRPLSQSVQVGGTHPEVVILNSHDATSSYRLMAGVFRLVCSNGLIVAESMVEDIRIKHTGAILSEVANGVDRIASQLPAISDRVAAMESLTLSVPEQQIFARAALTAKYQDQEAPINPIQVIVPRRAEDRPPTLWNTFNTVQEHLIRGGNAYRLQTERGVQRRQTNPVNSVDGQTGINRALWQLAEEMRRLKTAA